VGSTASFISYRREASAFVARSVYQDLSSHSFDTFLDVESIDAGNFHQVIDAEIRSRPYFLPVLTPGTLERCAESDDVLRAELDTARLTRRCIVPLVTTEFDRNDFSKCLTPALAEHYQGLNSVTIDHEYFESAMDKLRNRFLKPIDVPTRELPPEVAAEAERLRLVAAAQPKVDATTLQSQRHLERARALVGRDPDRAASEFLRGRDLLEQSNQLTQLSDEFNAYYLELQAQVKSESASFRALSDLMRVKHKSAMNSIHDIR
jgi:hypothetical protein